MVDAKHRVCGDLMPDSYNLLHQVMYGSDGAALMKVFRALCEALLGFVT